MSIDLLDALEAKIETAIQAIADLRDEVKTVKQERDAVQSKLQSVMDKIGSLDSQLKDAAKGTGVRTESSPNATSSSTSNVIGFGQSGSLGGSSSISGSPSAPSKLSNTSSPYSSSTESSTGGSSSSY